VASDSQIDDLKAQNQQQLEEINNIRFELNELKAKYLPKHIAVLAEHEDVRPAMIIASTKSCVAYNTYGEPLLISDSLCYQMNELPSLIPRSRQTQEVSASVDEPREDGFISPVSSSLPSVQPQQKPFESPRPYS